MSAAEQEVASRWYASGYEAGLHAAYREQMVTSCEAAIAVAAKAGRLTSDAEPAPSQFVRYALPPIPEPIRALVEALPEQSRHVAANAWRNALREQWAAGYDLASAHHGVSTSRPVAP